MHVSQFLSLVSQFAQRPLPSLESRHVYFWYGSLERLRDSIPSEALVRLDMRELALSLRSTPRARDQAARLLRQAIEVALRERVKSDRQQVLIVTGCDLISRYNVPLQPFFSLASERLMVVLALAPVIADFLRSAALPDYVTIRPSAPYEYLFAAVGEAATVNVTEDTP